MSSPWKRVEMPPKPYRLVDPSIAATSTVMAVFGGTEEGPDEDPRLSNVMYLYDFCSRAWCEVNRAHTTIAPTPRQGAVMCAVREKIYVLGGFGTTSLCGPVLSDAWVFNLEPGGGTWEPMPDAPVPFAGGSAVMDATESSDIYIFGGSPDPKDVLLQFDLTSNTWRSISYTWNGGPGQRSDHTAVTHDGKMFVFGGQLPPWWISTDDFWEFNFSTTQWRRLDEMGDGRPTRRFGHAACEYDGNMYVFGGCSSPTRDTFLADVHQYNFSTGKWQQLLLSPLVTPGRVLCSFVMDDCIHVNDDELYHFVPTATLSSEVEPMSPGFENYVNSEEFHDVVFLVGPSKDRVYGHRVILSRCSYLKRLLQHAWDGDVVTPVGGGPVEITVTDEEITTPLMTDLMHYIYCNELRVTDWKALAAMYDVAAKWTFTPLQVVCQRGLIGHLSPDSVFDIYALAARHTDAELREKAALFIIDHKVDISTDTHKVQLKTMLADPTFAADFVQLFYLMLNEGKER